MVRFPRQYDWVKFNKHWTIQDRYGMVRDIEVGTIAEVLEINISYGQSYDAVDGYCLLLGMQFDKELHIVKFQYLDRPDAITVIPPTPAAQVLFGKKNGQT